MRKREGISQVMRHRKDDEDVEDVEVLGKLINYYAIINRGLPE